MRVLTRLCGATLVALTVAGASQAESAGAPPIRQIDASRWVLEAEPVRRLSDTHWLFKTVYAPWRPDHLSAPSFFVGWWDREKPFQGGQAALPYRPAPQNAASITEGQRLLVLATQDLSLASVYPLGPDPKTYLRGMTRDEFFEWVRDIRFIHGCMDQFVEALADKDWRSAQWFLSDERRKELEATGNPEAYFGTLGLAWDVSRHRRPHCGIVSVGNDTAEVRVSIGVLRRVRDVITADPHRWHVWTLKLTKTNQRIKGRTGWEVADIKTAEDSVG